jgi:hypothetical protein
MWWEETENELSPRWRADLFMGSTHDRGLNGGRSTGWIQTIRKIQSSMGTMEFESDRRPWGLGSPETIDLKQFILFRVVKVDDFTHSFLLSQLSGIRGQSHQSSYPYKRLFTKYRLTSTWSVHRHGWPIWSDHQCDPYDPHDPSIDTEVGSWLFLIRDRQKFQNTILPREIFSPLDGLRGFRSPRFWGEVGAVSSSETPLKLIAWFSLTFDDRVVLRRVGTKIVRLSWLLSREVEASRFGKMYFERSRETPSTRDLRDLIWIGSDLRPEKIDPDPSMPLQKVTTCVTGIMMCGKTGFVRKPTKFKPKRSCVD